MKCYHYARVSVLLTGRPWCPSTRGPSRCPPIGLLGARSMHHNAGLGEEVRESITGVVTDEKTGGGDQEKLETKGRDMAHRQLYCLQQPER